MTEGSLLGGISEKLKHFVKFSGATVEDTANKSVIGRKIGRLE